MTAALITGLLVGFACQAATAGIKDGPTGAFSIWGHNYVNHSQIVTNTATHTAYAKTYTSYASGTTPAGYAGSRGRLYIPTAILMCQGSIVYNTGTQVVGNSCTKINTISTWFSQGLSYAWNGTAYSSFNTFPSPQENS